MRIGFLALGGWLVVAALSLGVSWTAISVVQDAVVASPDVSSGLPGPEETPGPTTAAPPSTAAPSRTPTPRPTAQAKYFAGTGGSVTVRCTDGRPALINVRPNQGYTVDPDDNGTEVEFRSDDHRTEMRASCTGTTPRVTVEEKDSGGGSGRGRGGGDDD